MKRYVGSVLMIFLIIGLVVPTSAIARAKKRAVIKPYAGPGGLMPMGDGSVALPSPQGEEGSVEFIPRGYERYVAFRIDDRYGGKIPASVQRDSNRDGVVGEGDRPPRSFCAILSNYRVSPGQRIRVVVHAGQCRDLDGLTLHPTSPTIGRVAAMFAAWRYPPIYEAG